MEETPNLCDRPHVSFSSTSGETTSGKSIKTGDTNEELVKLYVAQLPKTCDVEDVYTFFQQYGEIEELTIIKDKTTGKQKGCAFLTFRNNQVAQTCMETLNEKVPYPSCTNNLQIRPAESHDKGYKLFVGMLPKSVDEETLLTIFSSYGEIKEVHVIRGPDKQSKGCAFIKYFSKQAAINAIESANNKAIAASTRPIVVKFAANKRGGGGEGEIYDTEANGLGKQHPDQLKLWPEQGHFFYGNEIPPGASQGLIQMPYMSYRSSTGGFVYFPPSMQLHYGQSPPTFAQAEYPIRSAAQLGAKIDNMITPVLSHAEYSGRDSTQLDSSKESMYGRTSTYYVKKSHQNMRYDDRNMPMAHDVENMNSDRPPEGPSGANLFIYHLPRDLTDADLATLFAGFGKVISAKVFVDLKTGESKGFGFVSYDTPGSAADAISAMNGFQIGSKRLKVQLKRA